MTSERLIYFAGSIRGGRDDQALYFEIIDQLRQYGSVLTEHVGDAGISGDGETLNDRQIYDRDMAWLKKSDCLIAEVTTPSLGVGYEIGKASEWGKPVLCLFRPGDGRLLSAMIAGCKDVTLGEYQTTSELKKIIYEFLGDS
jgi:nucleoside 2-deoxyribosyltransferase